MSERTVTVDQYSPREWKPVSSAAAADSENSPGCFDCNICLDFANDPVVTLCGHLYCWPCIYKWFHVQNSSLDSDEHPQCPVCKSEISHTTLVPLYGRGQVPSKLELEGKSPYSSIVIPPRPPACGIQAPNTSSSHPSRQLPYRNPYQLYGDYEEDSRPPELFNLGSSTTMGVFNPVGGNGMFGEMVYSRVFGNSESLYTYPNSYHLAGSSSPRLRRREMQADQCLNRISAFLLCCFLLCLLLF